MKKIKTSICVWLALSAVFMTGCYNDEDLWNKISGLENRIEAGRLRPVAILMLFKS